MPGKNAEDQVPSIYADWLQRYGSTFGFGFINFGYWEGIDLDDRLSEADLVNSQKALYRNTLRHLDLDSNDRVLEVGCGYGAGCALTFEEFAPAEVRGVDLTPSHVENALRSHAGLIASSQGRLIFEQGSASALPCANGHFDKVFSVEAVQHFPDLEAFVSEIVRACQRRAQVAVTAAFSTSPEVTPRRWFEVLRTDSSVTYVRPASALTEALKNHGFIDVHVVSIGEHVWRGFDTWIRQSNSLNTVLGNWITAYEKHLVDYYLITAKLP